MRRNLECNVIDVAIFNRMLIDKCVALHPEQKLEQKLVDLSITNSCMEIIE
jgi:hypothetical protein